METINIMPNTLEQIEQAIKLLSDDKNMIQIPGNSGYFLVKANTSEGVERKNSNEALIVLEKEVDGKKYFICRR